MAAAAAGGGKTNRRALGDIGNLVTVRVVDGKQIPQVSQLVTRTLWLQMEMSQWVSAQEKPVARTASTKLKPTEIKSDSNGVEENNQKAVEKSSKTKNPTLQLSPQKARPLVG